MRTRLCILLFSIVTLAALLLRGAVLAQTHSEKDKGQATPPPVGDVTALPEMTVHAQPTDETSYVIPNATTATKTDTPIMETPISIQVVPQQVLKDQQAVRLEKALDNVSGVISGPSGVEDDFEQFSIRGFPTDVIYRDGMRVQLQNLATARRDPANLEQVEVLKGPASILYGRIEPLIGVGGSRYPQFSLVFSLLGFSGPSCPRRRASRRVVPYHAGLLDSRFRGNDASAFLSVKTLPLKGIEPGGIVNLVTKQPLPTPSYELGQQFGAFGFYRTTADATGPLTQDGRLGYRLNFAYENSGSFREFLQNERYLIAPVLRWNPTSQTEITVELEFRKTTDGLDTGIPLGANKLIPSVPRERNFGEPTDREQANDLLFGFHWSHAFNDHLTLRHHFYANTTDSNSRTTSTYVLSTFESFLPGFAE
jgi:outer membrane receptor protein involved in Fe transport